MFRFVIVLTASMICIPVGNASSLTEEQPTQGPRLQYSPETLRRIGDEIERNPNPVRDAEIREIIASSPLKLALGSHSQSAPLQMIVTSSPVESPR